MTKPDSGHAPDAARTFEIDASTQSSEHRLSIIYRPINQLKPNPANPRRHSRAQLRRLAQMIKKFGFRVPVLVDATGVIIAGHARWEAAALAGLAELPAILIDDLTDVEIKAFMIADNRIAEFASWDDKVLAEQFLELCQLNPDLSLELTGFDTGDIDFRIESLTRPAPDEADPADLIPPYSGPPISKLGDAWLLGPHKILCADARDVAGYTTLLGAKRAAAAFVDPPFNVCRDGHASGLGRARHREFVMAAGEMTEAQFTELLVTALRHLVDHSVKGALLYLWMDWRHLWEALGATRKVGCELQNLCVWVKRNAGMGSFYGSRHQLILVLTHGRDRHVNNIPLGRRGRNRSNVWEYRGANDFGRGDGEGNLLARHPTIKPVAMVADAITDCTKRGDIVLDAFLGSGSTIIAAERTGRKCYGIEVDPFYVDTVIRRWQAWTHGTARHAATGLTFEELAERREGGHGG